MQVLEKILEEIKKKVILVATSKEHYNQPQNGEYVEEVVTILEVEEIIRSHMDDATISEKESVRDNGWIPVEERLPDSINKILYDMNLVTLEDGEVCLGVYTDDKKEWRTRRTQGETLYTTEHNVIAWRPLPEPYKKGE